MRSILFTKNEYERSCFIIIAYLKISKQFLSKYNFIFSIILFIIFIIIFIDNYCVNFRISKGLKKI